MTLCFQKGSEVPKSETRLIDILQLQTDRNIDKQTEQQQKTDRIMYKYDRMGDRTEWQIGGKKNKQNDRTIKNNNRMIEWHRKTEQ